MGDRGNIAFREDKKSCIYFYTHWSGSDMPGLLADALEKGKQRWDDAPYLGRIIFQGLIGLDSGLTGYGISVALCDNEHDIIAVNCFDRTVSTHGEGDDKFESPNKTWKFEDYVKKFNSGKVPDSKED